MKKGFTLVELMAVIVLLGLVFIISYVAIEGIISKNKDRISEATKKIIYTATDNYIEDNIDSFPTTRENYCIDIDDLIEKDYLNENTISDEINSLKTYNKVLVTVDNSASYSYELVNTCEIEND